MKKKMFAALMAACMTVSVFGSVATVSAADGVTLTLYGNADDLAKPYMRRSFLCGKSHPETRSISRVLIQTMQRLSR